MIFEDEFVIQQPIQVVWDFFIDIPSVSTCVPGVERVEQADEGVYTGNLVVRVGPIGANFSGQVTILDLDPPHRLVAKVEGKDRATASIINGEFIASLEQQAGGSTSVHHKLDVAIRGRLGQFGTGVIQQVAKEVTAAFLACVRQELSATTRSVEDAAADHAETANTTGHEPTAHTARAPGVLVILVRAIVNAIGDALQRFLPGSTSKRS